MPPDQHVDLGGVSLGGVVSWLTPDWLGSAWSWLTECRSEPSGVRIESPSMVYGTGADLEWAAYDDPCNESGDDIVEYQVHRGDEENFTPSAATLVAPVSADTTSYLDTTAEPTSADSADPLARTHHYRVVVRTRDGDLVAGPALAVQVPKAGRVARATPSGSTPRVMLSNSTLDVATQTDEPAVEFVTSATEATYFAPYTPARMVPGTQYTVEVTLTNTTDETWPASDRMLSYRWELPDGTDVTTPGNRLETELPADLAPGESVTVQASVRTPIQSESGNKRQTFVLNWDVLDTASRQWLSESDGIEPLAQDVAVESPTSDLLGLETSFQYVGTNTGAGSKVLNNLHAGNTVFSYDALANPGRGLATFLRMTYNSQDTSSSSMGYGWSLSASSLHRLGAPLDLHPRGQEFPREVRLTDGDGTSHLFELNTHASDDPADWDYDKPAGVHLYLQKNGGGDESRAWVMTRPDRTQFFFDEDGYLSATVDNNGNELTFSYTERRSNNRPTKFLVHITDASGQQTLTLDYYARGDDYFFIDDDGNKVSASRLTNPHIIDQVRSITDISGRRIELTYTAEGLLGEMVDGAGDERAKVFGFGYHMEQGTNNVKLVEVTDPRGNSTELAYYDAPVDPKHKWWLQTITDRVGGQTHFDYADPDGSPAGPEVQTTVTDAEQNSAVYLMDSFGRPMTVTNAKGEVTRLGWDADNNVVRLEEDNGAVRRWTYDAKTGYPTSITDAQANADGTPGTTLEYQRSLNGHVAELTARTSPEGRRWEFGYDERGNLTKVTDPKGTATGEGHTTIYTYDEFGQLATATDANGNQTTYDDFHPSGYPRIITDALDESTRFGYDERGNVTSVTDALDKTSEYTYDVFGRSLGSRVPTDEDAGEFIVTPPPVYDPNDNVVETTAPNGAVTTVEYDPADRPVRGVLPQDTSDSPERVVTMTYDGAGNLLTETEPRGNLPSAEPDEFTTRYVYDEIYQLVEIVDAEGGRTTYEYDNVGNLVASVDPRKNASGEPEAFTVRQAYDLAHRVTSITDAAGHETSSTYDLDGLVTATTDQEGVTTLLSLDERGKVSEVRVPHAEEDGGITYRTTRYEYDEVGNRTRVITPRGVEAAHPDAFVQETVYDELNRVSEEIYPFDPNDPRHNTPDRTTYTYDEVGNLASVSAPPSEGQTVRNETSYTHFDNGWVRTSTDPWDIITSYDYNDLGLQTEATVTSAGGSQSRTIGWSYYPDGKLAARSDDGVPAGLHVVLVDNSDIQNTETTGEWTSATDGVDLFGIDYQTAPAGVGSAMFTWDLRIPADGTYAVEVRHPEVAGAATDAELTIAHAGGEDIVTVDQTQQAGEWVSLGEYEFTADGEHQVTLSDDAGGTVVADAVKLVRDNSGETDTEQKSIEYIYDVNGNLVQLTDTSEGAEVDQWSMSHDGLNRVTLVEEINDGVVGDTTRFTYDANGNPLTRTHDGRSAELSYDERDSVVSVTHTEPGVPEAVARFTYTPKGRVDTETAANGDTVDYEYYLDGLIRRQVERRSDGSVVNEHTLTYMPNSHIAEDVARTQSADDAAELLERTSSYKYDPRDRLTEVTRSPVGDAEEAVQSYVLDANGNTVSQTIDEQTTTYVYDRNRLLSATAEGGTTSGYNYDPYGRLDTVVSGGEVLEKYTYDGFDRIVRHRAGTGAQAETTTYVYDPFDRRQSRTEDAGTAEASTTDLSYLGVDDSVVAEEVDGELTRTYQYGAQGERLAMVAHDEDPQEFSVYGYDTRGNVELLTDLAGNARATYGYTAYGSPDTDLMTGVDAPDPADPDARPYNTFRFQAKQLDPATDKYDMGTRDYDPGLNRFLTRDLFLGALDDLGLVTDPFTMGRYAFGGGNPLSRIEWGGHWGWSDIGHAVLDVAGAVPVVGEVADLANAAWYTAEGNYADAALSAAAAIPFVGWGATAVKAGKYAYKGVDAARSGARGVDEAADLANATRRTDVPSTRAPDAPSAPRDASPTPRDTGSTPRDTTQQPTPPAAPAPKPAPAPATNTGSRFVPDDATVVRGGTKDMPPPGEVFSGAYGRSLEEAASGVPHGQIRVTTAGEIRRAGGTVEYAPELTRSGVMNYLHVNVCLGPGACPFGPLIPNPVPKAGRIQ